jgi:hypothetical protein
MNSAPVQMKIFLDATVENPQNPKSFERRPMLRHVPVSKSATIKPHPPNRQPTNQPPTVRMNPNQPKSQ